MNLDGSRVFYRSEFWKKLAADCKRRDNYQCQGCRERAESGKEVAALHAHHRISRRPLPFPTELDTLSNLTTLCVECHQRQHKHQIAPSKNFPPKMFRANFRKRRFR